jgi:hypothetical protein
MSDPSYVPNVYHDANGLNVKAAGGPGIRNDNGSVVFNLRTRVTIAQVNAGLTLVAAIPGYKLRLIDALMIAVGGAAAAVTTVDILGTQAAGGVKLVAAAQASLTQSTVLRAGGAGAAVLADGASFAQNDVNTPITIGKTGASVTTATAIDVILTFAIEP